MRKAKITSSILGVVGILMISIAMVLQNDEAFMERNSVSHVFQEVDIKSMAASSNMIVKEKNLLAEEEQEKTPMITEVKMETAPASVIIPPRVEVYDHMTLEELAQKLNRNLGSGYLAGKGQLIASYCIEKKVDPYLAVAIILHETGCRSNCSKLVRTCNNVGGQKGSPGCNGGSYKAYATLDDGIRGFVDNLQRNYYARGLTTVDTIGPKYAESSNWISMIYSYINQIKAN